MSDAFVLEIAKYIANYITSHNLIILTLLLYPAHFIVSIALMKSYDNYWSKFLKILLFTVIDLGIVTILYMIFKAVDTFLFTELVSMSNLILWGTIFRKITEILYNPWVRKLMPKGIYKKLDATGEILGVETEASAKKK